MTTRLETENNTKRAYQYCLLNKRHVTLGSCSAINYLGVEPRFPALPGSLRELLKFFLALPKCRPSSVLLFPPSHHYYSLITNATPTKIKQRQPTFSGSPAGRAGLVLAGGLAVGTVPPRATQAPSSDGPSFGRTSRVQRPQCSRTEGFPRCVGRRPPIRLRHRALS